MTSAKVDVRRLPPALLLLSLAAATAVPAAAQSSASYYVNAATGSDTAAGTTAAAPWKTIQKAASTVPAGSTVNIAAGTYKEKITVNVSGSAAGGYITFKGVPSGTGALPVLDGTGLGISGNTAFFTINGKSHIRIQGLEMRNLKSSSASPTLMGVFVTGKARNIEILGNDIHHIEATHPDGNAHAILIYGRDYTTTGAITGTVISGNKIHDNKLGNSEAVAVNGNVDGFAVTDNVLTSNNNIGIDAIGYEGPSSGAALDQARNGVITGNTVIGSSTTSNPSYGTYSSGGIYVDGGRDILIERNIVTGSDFGIDLGSEHAGRSTSGVTVRNNFLFRNKAGGIGLGGYDTLRGSARDCKVVNNTLFQNDTLEKDGEIQVRYDTLNNVIKNNIVFARPGTPFIYNEFTKNSGNVVDSNLYYVSSGAGAGTWRWKNVAYTGWTSWQKTATANKSGNDQNGQFANPQLVSETSPDLHLKATSPAIDKGDSSAFLAATDFDGQARTMGVKVDQGADEVNTTPPPPTPPAAPTGLIGTGGIATATLQWTDNASNETSFRIERAPSAAPTSFAEVGSVNAGTTTFSESLSPGDYNYRVRASNSAGDSAYSNTVTVTVTAPPTPPAAPSDLTAAGGEGQVLLTWVDNASDESQFLIERRQEPAGNFVQIATAQANTTTFTNTGLAAGDYSYRVRATNSGGPSSYSNLATATVTAPPGPAAPSNLGVTTTGGNSATLTWVDNATNESGYRVERKVGSGGFVTLATKPSNATSHTDAGLTANSYTYRVVATGTVASPPSNEAQVVITGAAADTFVKSGTNAGFNYGGSAVMEVKLTPDPNTNRNAFLRFSLASVAGTVTSAKLRLYGWSKDSAKPVAVYPVSSTTWTEGTANGTTTSSGITWNTAPAIGATAVGAEQTVPLGTAPFAWVEWDLTAYVQAQRTAGQSICSLALKSQRSSEDGQITFSSRQATANPPVLIITTAP